MRKKLLLYCCFFLLVFHGGAEGREMEKVLSQAGGNWTRVEEAFLKESGRKRVYLGEKISVIETDNVCSLGKLTALRFLEWVEQNPTGVIALPTGKTPELFIKFLHRYKKKWQEPDTRNELQSYGVFATRFPDTSQLKFVQLDEFYPIDASHKNSFTYYVKKYYIDFFGIAEENILTINLASQGILKKKGIQAIFPEGKVDLSLITRGPKNPREILQKRALSEAQQFCRDYERKIRQWGGIGFFLGGIGPDGHIAFNLPGSTQESETRLVQLNYPSAAAASHDLGGIEYSRDKVVITIGLGTITFNPDAVIIIFAAGEGKAVVVKAAIENSRNVEYPATLLHKARLARFYISKGASSQLAARRVEDIAKTRISQLSQEVFDDVIIELALKENKQITSLTVEDFSQYPRSAALLAKYSYRIEPVLQHVQQRLADKISKGVLLPKNRKYFHTAPHHDDIMLSYHPIMKDLLKDNINHFMYVTSGFHAVTDIYLNGLLKVADSSFLQANTNRIFDFSYDAILEEFTSAKEKKQRESIETVLLLRRMSTVYGVDNAEKLFEKVQQLKEYLLTKQPGDKNSHELQILKGGMRETEADRMWHLFGVPSSKIFHMCSKFYTDDYFTPLPTIDADAAPVLKLYQEYMPNVITVAFDPEGTGPSTHYKVLQVIAQALRLGGKEYRPDIWGYRNVWYRFNIAEANLMFPVSDENIEQMNSAFLSCFSTQKNASFPSPDYDGPFSLWSEQVLRNQKKQLQILLGADFFANHHSEKVRNSKGFVFIKSMNKEEFFSHAEDLKARIELFSGDNTGDNNSQIMSKAL